MAGTNSNLQTVRIGHNGKTEVAHGMLRMNNETAVADGMAGRGKKEPTVIVHRMRGRRGQLVDGWNGNLSLIHI